MDRRTSRQLVAGSLAVSSLVLLATTVAMAATVAVSAPVPAPASGPTVGHAERAEPVSSRPGQRPSRPETVSSRLERRAPRPDAASSRLETVSSRAVSEPQPAPRLDPAIRSAGAQQARARASADQGPVKSSMLRPKKAQAPARPADPPRSPSSTVTSGDSERTSSGESRGGAARASSSTRTAATREAPPRYRGRNHFWYPALGMDQSVSWFSCDRSSPPGAPTYRWGCAGRGNVYLMAHNYGNFNPLYRAYYNGALDRGELAVYADDDGDIHYFRLAWYRVAPPTTDAAWAWSSQSTSSMTLQTCVGKNDSLRLFVRFTEVSGP